MACPQNLAGAATLKCQSKWCQERKEAKAARLPVDRKSPKHCREQGHAGSSGAVRSSSAKGRGPIMGGIAGSCEDRGFRQRLLVVKHALHRLIAALHGAGLHVVLAGAHAGPDVLRLTAPAATGLRTGEVGIANHLPDGLDAVVRILGVRIVPGILAQSSQVSKVSGVGRTILLSDQSCHTFLFGTLRFRYCDVVVNRPLTEADGECCVFHGGAVPLRGVTQSMKVFEAWEHWVDASAHCQTRRKEHK